MKELLFYLLPFKRSKSFQRSCLILVGIWTWWESSYTPLKLGFKKGLKKELKRLSILHLQANPWSRAKIPLLRSQPALFRKRPFVFLLRSGVAVKPMIRTRINHFYKAWNFKDTFCLGWKNSPSSRQCFYDHCFDDCCYRDDIR